MRIADPDDEDVVLGYATPDICASLGIAPATLHKWATGEPRLVEASLADATGRRSTRYWTPEDYVLIRVVKALRLAGCAPGIVAGARPLLDGAWAKLGGEDHLYWDGSDLIEVTDWGEVRSRLQQPGQLLMHYIATPLWQWRDAARSGASRYVKADYELLLVRREADRVKRQSKLGPSFS